METILQKIPAELKDRMNRRQLPDDTPIDTPSEKSLIRLHKQVLYYFFLMHVLCIFFSYAYANIYIFTNDVGHFFQTIKALQTLQRVETLWGITVDKIIHLEDVEKNQVSHERRFKPTFPVHRSFPLRIIYNPIIGKKHTI